VENSAVGLIVTGSSDAGVPSHVIGTSTLFTRTRVGKDGVAGHGVNVNSGARLELTTCAVTDNHEVGLSVAGGVVTAYDSVFTGTSRNGNGDFGHGVLGVVSALADQAATVIHLSNASVTGNASVGLMAAGVAGSVERSVFEGNETAVHAQAGTTVQQVDAPPATLGPLQLVITNDTLFYGNTSVSGSGTLALPSSLTRLTGP
jgi:hypothetical protein